jgi:glucuronoarabinoxylan endo-1,4-beta-xylanase
VALDYRVPAAGLVRLVIFDALGREVASIVEGRLEAGSHRSHADVARLLPGVYLLRLESGGAVVTRSMVVAR